jgi:hypothetical protein
MANRFSLYGFIGSSRHPIMMSHIVTILMQRHVFPNHFLFRLFRTVGAPLTDRNLVTGLRLRSPSKTGTNLSRNHLETCLFQLRYLQSTKSVTEDGTEGVS